MFQRRFEELLQFTQNVKRIQHFSTRNIKLLTDVHLSPKGWFPSSTSASKFQSEKDNLLCAGGSLASLTVNLCLSSFLLCCLCSKSNEPTSLFLLSWDIFCFSFLKITQFSQGLSCVVYRGRNTAWEETCHETNIHFLTLNFQTKCFYTPPLPHHPSTNVWIVQHARGVIFNGTMWWP